MNSVPLVIEVIDALEASGVPYMITGSLATNLYGVVRSTKDADFVLDLGERPISFISSRLPGFLLDPQMSFETITSTTRYRLKHRESEFMIELFLLSEDEHDQARFQRRRRAQFEDRDTWAPAPEDAIIMKLRWSLQGARPKDVDDAKWVIGVQAERLDWPYLETWCARHGTLALLHQLRDDFAKRVN